MCGTTFLSLIPAWVITVSGAENPKPGNPIFVPKKRTQNMSERGKKHRVKI
jgi:hypothetical protein